jgi:hypothetical protein
MTTGVAVRTGSIKGVLGVEMVIALCQLVRMRIPRRPFMSPTLLCSCRVLRFDSSLSSCMRNDAFAEWGNWYYAPPSPAVVPVIILSLVFLQIYRGKEVGFLHQSTQCVTQELKMWNDGLFVTFVPIHVFPFPVWKLHFSNSSQLFENTAHSLNEAARVICHSNTHVLGVVFVHSRALISSSEVESVKFPFSGSRDEVIRSSIKRSILLNSAWNDWANASIDIVQVLMHIFLNFVPEPPGNASETNCDVVYRSEIGKLDVTLT